MTTLNVQERAEQARNAAAKKEMLTRIRNANALAGVKAEPYPVPRAYETGRTVPAEERIELLVDRLVDYKAEVHVVTAAELPATVAKICADRGVKLLGVAEGMEASIFAEVKAEVELDDRSTDPRTLDRFDAVLTDSHVTSAQTGTIFLDGSASNGRRALTLVPDCHICVVREPSIVFGVPEAVERLDPTHPTTLISGPSATSDIELRRVEGVHGPRTLIVVIVK